MSVKVKQTDGLRVRQLATELKLPVATVEQVVKAWDKARIQDLMNGKDISIVGLMSVYLMDDVEKGTVTVRGKVSPVLRKRIQEQSKNGFQRCKRTETGEMVGGVHLKDTVEPSMLDLDLEDGDTVFVSDIIGGV